MQRSCAHKGKHARLVARQARTLTSVRAAFAHAPGRPHGKKPRKNALNQTKTDPCQYKPVQVSTSEYNQ
jgi:hypothetical protein